VHMAPLLFAITAAAAFLGPITPVRGPLARHPTRMPLQSCRTGPPALATFGMDGRQIKRLSEMKRADEPLSEELEGLVVLGAASGFLLIGPAFGSPVLGALLGVQAAPLFAFAGGRTGERARAVGWEVNVEWQRGRKAALRLWTSAQRVSERRGLTRQLRLLRDRVLAFDERTGASKLVRRWATLILGALRSMFARVRRLSATSGLTAKLHELWRRTGLPNLIEEAKDRAILSQRMDDIRHGRRRPGEQGGGVRGFSDQGI
jgi:hypothetical protein